MEQPDSAAKRGEHRSQVCSAGARMRGRHVFAGAIAVYTSKDGSMCGAALPVRARDADMVCIVAG